MFSQQRSTIAGVCYQLIARKRHFASAVEYILKAIAALNIHSLPLEAIVGD